MSSQSKKVKNEILASKISVVRSLNNEQALKYELTLFFQDLKKSVLSELEEFYSEDFMFQAHADLILAPIFEAQQEYYNILRKFNHKEYQFGRKTGRRLVKLARKKAKKNTLTYADKASKTPSILKAIIKKDELFGTNPWSEQKLLNQTFTASERTMNRIDSDINKILSDGYREGKGINVVRNDITKRFDQLSSWEATRIARTEIHNAHNMGTMDIYQEMGVEYTQWIAAHDSRTRTSHLDVDREIIPMGGTYSNDLRYPGDTTGPLKEWINCRCSNAPFVIPEGYITPSSAPFKEEDLIPTLDYWKQDDLIAQATQEAGERQAQLYGIPIKESLMENKFAVPSGDYSEFGISKNGLKTVQQIQKRNFGESREYGFCFDNKTGRILTDEIQGTSANVEIPKLKRKGYSSIHNHTDNSLAQPSPDDFYDHWLSKNETSAFHISRNETWVIKVDNISQKKIDNLCEGIYDIEVNQIEKMVKEYDSLKLMVKKGKMTQKELDEYLANDFIYKHNKECGDKILKYTSNIKGVKVKRVFNNTKANPNKIKDLKGIKTKKYNGKGKYLRKAPEIKKDKKEKYNWNYEYDNVKYSFKGNTPTGRNNFLKKYGVDVDELNRNPQHKSFLVAYTDEGDTAINGYLRGLKSRDNAKKEWNDVIDDLLERKQITEKLYFDEALKVYEEIFEKYSKTLEENIIVCRREDERFMGKEGAIEYYDDGFTSTSIYEYVEKYGDEINYILIPEGTKVIYLEEITMVPEDYEILIAPGIHLDLIEDLSPRKKVWK